MRRCAQGDVVTRLFHLDTEARRDKIGRLKAAFREQEDAELTFAPAGAGGKRSADKTKRGTGSDGLAWPRLTSNNGKTEWTTRHAEKRQRARQATPPCQQMDTPSNGAPLLRLRTQWLSDSLRSAQR